MPNVIALRDAGWVDFKTDYQQWNHACTAYGATLQIVDDLSKANFKGEVVIFEETGEVELADFVHPENCTYVFGRSCLNGLTNMIEHNHSVRINTPNKICLFGITAVGIALHDRMIKWQ